MRVVFLGTPEFAVPSLESLLLSRFEVAAVITQPDRASGRGHRVRPSPVKAVAQSHGIRVHQPARIRDEENRPLFEELEPDFLVVVAYGQILPGWLLRRARIAPVNVHGSLLPAYRGAAPVQWAVLNGERRTGVCTMLMDEGLDTGPVLLAREHDVPPDITAGGLAKILAASGAALLLPTLEGLIDGSVVPIPQDNTRASFAPRIRKEMGLIDWSRPAAAIHNQIRGLSPWPLAFSDVAGQRVQILRASVVGDAAIPGLEPGCVIGVSANGLLVHCGNDTVLDLLEVKPESRACMSGRAFAAGARLEIGRKDGPVPAGRETK